MQWISRLALIAYLVGGWIIPATHRHDHAHQVPAGTHCAESVGSDSVQEDCGCQCHQASPVCVATQDDLNDPSQGDTESGDTETADAENLAQGSHAHPCEGLCAICAAVTLCATQEDLVNDGYRLNPIVGDRVYSPIYLTCEFHLSGNLSSRGPPVNL